VNKDLSVLYKSSRLLVVVASDTVSAVVQYVLENYMNSIKKSKISENAPIHIIMSTTAKQ